MALVEVELSSLFSLDDEVVSDIELSELAQEFIFRMKKELSKIRMNKNFLIGIGFGYDTFVAVGTYGNVLRSTDNGSSWDNSTSPTLNQLRGVGF